MRFLVAKKSVYPSFAQPSNRMRSNYVLGLDSQSFHRMHYTDWGDPANPRVVICVHGLTRNARDFDWLAQALCDTYRVICPDMPGRGLSDWLKDYNDYAYSVYLNDIAVLLGYLHVTAIDWVGTSMGGLMGMCLAAREHCPIRKMVLNDIGPEIPGPALERMATYVGRDPHFPDLDGVKNYFKAIHAPFGLLSEDVWAHMAQHGAKRIAEGEYRLHYDPRIGEGLRQKLQGPADLWSVWDAVRCAVRVLRGTESDVLTHAAALQMARRGPRANLVEFSGIGHVPALTTPDQIAAIREWLLAD